MFVMVCDINKQHCAYVGDIYSLWTNVYSKRVTNSL